MSYPVVVGGGGHHYAEVQSMYSTVPDDRAEDILGTAWEKMMNSYVMFYTGNLDMNIPVFADQYKITCTNPV